MVFALGLAAASWAVVMALAPILQIREILRRRSSEGVSIGYFTVLLVGFGLWVSYGTASHDLPLVVPNSLALLVMACTITAALTRRRARPQVRLLRSRMSHDPRTPAHSGCVKVQA
jgi:MtN3 and saliva related transmembrane protein